VLWKWQMLNSKDSGNMGEINLSDLFGVLWLNRWLVVGLTFLITLIGVAYVFIVQPVYEVKAFAIPPTQNDIANLNYGRVRDTELKPLTVTDVYSVFLQHLRGENLRQSFISEVMMPELSKEYPGDSKELKYAEVAKRIVVSQFSREIPDKYMVAIQGRDPAQAAKWAEEYIQRAGILSKQEIIKDVSYEAEVRVRSLERQISELRENGQKVREDTITKLREALRVASAIGLEKPPIISGNPAVQIAGSLDGQLIYMRGTKALEAEIENLEKRESNDPFIQRLRDLESTRDFYASIPLSLSDAKTYRMDGAVEQASSAIKPKKFLIIIFSVLFGLIVGCGFVFVRHLFRTRSASV
jgi:chain length determinant protein (polysaccharide antigen chain regulator)